MKAANFSRTFICKPVPVATATSIMIIPSAIAVIPIFIIGPETLLLYVLALIMRFAIKYSNFKRNDMIYNFIKNTSFLLVLAGNLILFCSCAQGQQQHKSLETNQNKEQLLKNTSIKSNTNCIPGANFVQQYLPLLQNKNVGIVANQTSVIFKQPSKHQDQYTHLVDSLLSLNVAVKKVFAPEHGFRGHADAGEVVKDGKDATTGLPIFSLYGKNKKPSANLLNDLDVMIFDIQDVGARFYTYISTLHYIMEACAEQHIPLIILDRPNPNGHYIDGPILETEFKSFVGMHPVPVVHGMTIGEYAQMINGEKWLNNGVQCTLTIINTTLPQGKNTRYSLPIKPSPNLPNDTAINLYPSLCFFEGTDISVGRGTDLQFQVIGSPKYPLGSYAFVPSPNAGAKHPKHKGKTCLGINLSSYEYLNELNLSWLLLAYKKHQKTTPNNPFFNSFFEKLAGTRKLQEQIEAGWTEQQIKESWKSGLSKYNEMRKKYLLY